MWTRYRETAADVRADRRCGASGDVLKDALHENEQRCFEDYERYDNGGNFGKRICDDVRFEVSSDTDKSTGEHHEGRTAGRGPKSRRSVEQRREVEPIHAALASTGTSAQMREHICAHGRGGLSRRSLEPVAREAPRAIAATVKGTNVEVFDEREFRRAQKEFLSSTGDGSALVPWMDISIALQTIGENSSYIANRMWPPWEYFS